MRASWNRPKRVERGFEYGTVTCREVEGTCRNDQIGLPVRCARGSSAVSQVSGCLRYSFIDGEIRDKLRVLHNRSLLLPARITPWFKFNRRANMLSG